MSSGRQNANSSSTIPGSLRPRVNRLISIDDEVQTVSNDLSSLTTNGESSLFGKWPTTSTTSSTSTLTQRTTIDHRGKRKGTSGPSSLFSAELWTTSWSSVQDVATTILGNNLKDDPSGRSSKTSHARHRSQPNHPYSLSGPSEAWGPSGNSASFIAAGTTEDRRAEVQAKKREALLAADAAIQADTLGKYKRKLSYDRIAASSSQHDPDHEVLVYLHHVVQSDTLAGLSIKYGCSQEVIRKTNRLWPNDTIQIRRQAYVPVDSCNIRGQRVEDPTSLLNSDLDQNTAPSSSTIAVSTISEPNTTASISRTSSTTKSRSLSITSNATSSTGLQSIPWTHSSWTRLPTSSNPIEIVRLPARYLGYFPPTRRKSIPYTDEDPLADDPLNTQSILASSPEPHPASSKVFTSQLPPSRSVSHSRTRLPLSSRHNASPPSQRHRDPASFLHGPGGVGTMDFNVRKPGPAPDRLNEIFGPHLLNLAPPSQPQSRLSPRPSRSHLAPTSAGFPPHRSHSSAPSNAAIAGRTSFESVTSSNSVGIVGDAIEGWMRKVAGRGRANTLDPGISDSAPANQGDLIELMESTSTIQNVPSLDETYERDEKERQRRELEERFPARGRVFGSQGTSHASSGKRGW